jgi:hypothetical protein
MVQPVYQSGIYCLPKWYAVVTEKWYTVGYRLQLPISFEHDENIIRKNVPVILPAPIKDGWELLRNYTRPHGTQLNFRSAKYSIKTVPILDSRLYHNMFFESFVTSK